MYHLYWLVDMYHCHYLKQLLSSHLDLPFRKTANTLWERKTDGNMRGGKAEGGAAVSAAAVPAVAGVAGVVAAVVIAGNIIQGTRKR